MNSRDDHVCITLFIQGRLLCFWVLESGQPAGDLLSRKRAHQLRHGNRTTRALAGQAAGHQQQALATRIGAALPRERRGKRKAQTLRASALSGLAQAPCTVVVVVGAPPVVVTSTLGGVTAGAEAEADVDAAPFTVSEGFTDRPPATCGHWWEWWKLRS